MRINKLIEKCKQFCKLAAQGLITSKMEAAKILGVSIDAAPEKVNKAYKEKAKKLHPDQNPNVDPIEIKLLNSAKEIMLSQEPEQPQLEEDEPEPDNPSDLSYEDIAEMRKEIGREEFNKKYPGWEGELKREMGLDEYNKTFEGYDPNYDPYYDDPYRASDMERMDEGLHEEAKDQAEIIFEQGLKDKKIDLYTSFTDFIEENKNIIKYPEWVVRQSLEKQFNKYLAENLHNILFDNLDKFDIDLDYVLGFPNEKVIASFLSRNDNIEKYTIPDKLLGSRNFLFGIIDLMQDHFYEAVEFFAKYRNNKHFIKNFVQNPGSLHRFKGNEKAIKLINSLPFNDKEREMANRFLRDREY